MRKSKREGSFNEWRKETHNDKFSPFLIIVAAPIPNSYLTFAHMHGVFEWESERAKEVPLNASYHARSKQWVVIKKIEAYAAHINVNVESARLRTRKFRGIFFHLVYTKCCYHAKLLLLSVSLNFSISHYIKVIYNVMSSIIINSRFRECAFKEKRRRGGEGEERREYFLRFYFHNLWLYYNPSVFLHMPHCFLSSRSLAHSLPSCRIWILINFSSSLSLTSMLCCVCVCIM